MSSLPFPSKTFLEGPSGAGKTTLAVEWMRGLLARGIPGNDILVLVPQKTLAQPYYDAIQDPTLAGGLVHVSTVGGLAQRMVELFWPLAAEPAGFAAPHNPPTFLNLETAQYHMARIVRPLIENEGFFEGVTLDRNRLYSQILDNLNKAAFIRFPHTEIGARLSAAWIGDGAQTRIYTDAQECANRFRAYCLAHNLLDFSLWLETFQNYLWPDQICRDHLITQYPHLIFDNLEEDTPAAHDLLRDWLPDCQTALLLYDSDAGYRRFLGADPLTAHALHELCHHHLTLPDSHVISPEMDAFRRKITNDQSSTINAQLTIDHSQFTIDNSSFPIHYSSFRFYPQLLDWLAAEIQRLIHEEGT
ncbi:MAG: DEAD/DEAH box helicase family protein, partial [Anaerolineales bacterium]|nr:DEAD/DEAH box helicase family protein [Anaerolineales bacterium]